jgi:hypothetical protein
VNEAIRAREVRAVFPDGSVEVMATHLAVKKAQEMGLDLILIAPTAEPPVAKAMDYGQWQYENKKKAARSQAQAAHHPGEGTEIPSQHRRSRLRLQKKSRDPLLERRESRESGRTVPRP